MNENPQGTPLAVEPQDEQLPVVKITIVAVVTLIVFAVGVAWSVAILRSQTGGVNDANLQRVPADQIGKAEIGIVDQKMFQNEKRAEQMRDAKLEHLAKPGWVSKRQQMVHIPITAAMQAVADGKQVRAPAVPEQQTPTMDGGVDSNPQQP